LRSLSVHRFKSKNSLEELLLIFLLNLPAFGMACLPFVEPACLWYGLPAFGRCI
jgi:hypothetical protein